jgi:hypothetical protein
LFGIRPDPTTTLRHAMKSILALCLAAFLSTPFALADQEHIFPDKGAMIELKLPDDWEAQVKNGRLYAHPPDDKDFFVEFEEMQSKPDDGEAVMKEAKASLAESFKKLEYGEVQKARYTELSVVLMDVTGEDDAGKVNLNVVLVVDEKKNKVVMVTRIASPESAKKHAAAWGKIVSSFKAVKPN